MKMNSLRGSLFYFLISSFALLFPDYLLAQEAASVFPQPNNVTNTDDAYRLKHDHFRIRATDGEQETLKTVEAQFKTFHHLSFVYVSDEADLSLEFLAQIPAEGYQLVINSKGIRITYSTSSGLFYAMQTLDQWMMKAVPTQLGLSINGVSIDDSPRFAYRGVHLDCSRHFFTIPEVKQFIDQAARLKLNKFHWHLTDDQGWRIEIKRYPKLTEVGAWRDSTIVGHYSRSPRVYEKEHYGGFYSQEEAKEIVRYAAARGITVIPEIELPGHARAALAAYPELGCTGEQLPVEGLWGVFDDIFCSKPETITFLQNVLEEVIAIFPSETIHIGGDEAPKVRWDACPKCKQVREQNGLHDSHELQSHVVHQMEEFLRARGRKLMGWDEILEGGLADNAQVMSWRGTEGGIAAAKAHHPVVMTPMTHCYFDYYQSGHPDEPLAIGGYLPLEKVYAFNPLPTELSPAEQAYILGGQANLWTEYLPTMDAVCYQAYPRLVAMAEVLWSKNLPEYEVFVSQLVRSYLPRLEQEGIRFSTAFLDPVLAPSVSRVYGAIVYNLNAPLKEVDMMIDGQKNDQFILESTPLPQTKQIRVSAGLGGQPLRSTEYTFTTHALIGKPVQLITPPHPKYNHHDSLALTDGVVGKRPWKGNQWLGYLNDTVQFSIDLGFKRTFSEVRLGCLHDPGSWIYQPKKIRIETSKNGKTFKLLKETAIISEAIAIPVKGKTRFVRITLINDPLIPAGNPGAGTVPWTFIDEFMIIPKQ